MSKIIQLKTENVMRLKAVNIKPDGSLVIIGGDNGQGKSSTLNAIAMALGGKDQVPPVPIHKGADKGSIVVDLGDMIVRRTFTPNGGGSLVIEDKEKKRFPSPQALLDSLTGRLTFDPLSFLAQKPKEQLESLKTLVGLDFTAEDEERERTYNERTVVNREVERAQMTLSQAAHFPEIAGPADLTALNAEMREAQAHNEKLNGLQTVANNAKNALTVVDTQLKQATERQREITAEIEALKLKLKEQEEWKLKIEEKVLKLSTDYLNAKSEVEAFKPQDVQAVQQKLSDASEQNRKHATNTARAALVKTLADKKGESEKLTKAINDIDERKQKKLSAAKFPVDGLSFGAGEVLFGGLPFSQASEAERYRVSVAMAAAMNPKLRVALVRNGSLLDQKNMALLEQLATAYDLQVWIERVGSADPSAIIIEDGMVKGAPIAETVKQPEQEQIKDLIL